MPKLAILWGIMFYIDLFMDHLKLSSLKTQSIESIFGMQYHLVDLLSLLKIMALWSKMRPPRGPMFYIAYIENKLKHILVRYLKA